MFPLEDSRPLIILPDIHQDVALMRSALEHATSHCLGVAGIVLLGDLLDGRNRTTMTYDAARETLEEVYRWIHGSIPLCWLWGNHDWLYRGLGREDLSFQDFDEWECDALTNAAVEEVGGLPVEHMRLVLSCRGWLLSHAGVAPRFWEDQLSVEANVESLNARFFGLKNAALDTPDWALTDAGPARGGFAEVGGPLWLDWLAEFEDALPVPQLVGHSSGHHPKRKGRSVCVDCVQSVYATLAADGCLTTHRICA